MLYTKQKKKGLGALWKQVFIWNHGRLLLLYFVQLKPSQSSCPCSKPDLAGVAFCESPTGKRYAAETGSCVSESAFLAFRPATARVCAIGQCSMGDRMPPVTCKTKRVTGDD